MNEKTIAEFEINKPPKNMTSWEVKKTEVFGISS